jgi:glucose-1-phosphate cytidylyltransferase
MKVVILAGGAGTRLGNETADKPKALVKIGDHPILWHIMKYFSYFGFKEFVIAIGYKGEVITEWISNYCESTGNHAIKDGKSEIVFQNKKNGWIIHLVETGQKTQTGGRIKMLTPWLCDQTFMLTFCDGLADVDLLSLLSFHNSHKRLATLTAVRPKSRFGHLVLKGDNVIQFNEKPPLDWINGGFFVFEPDFLNYIEADDTQLEKEPMEKLAKDNQLIAFRHNGFWQCMDTISEKRLLNKLWFNGNSPWKIW